MLNVYSVSQGVRSVNFYSTEFITSKAFYCRFNALKNNCFIIGLKCQQMCIYVLNIYRIERTVRQPAIVPFLQAYRKANTI